MTSKIEHRQPQRARATRLASTMAIAGLCSLSAASAKAADCTSLAQQAVPFSNITIAELVTGGSFTPPGSTTPITGLPDFCRVKLIMTPTSDSSIVVEVWLPATTWNGRLQGLGGGGYTGTINYGSLATTIKSGYVAANTDMGTYPASGGDGRALVGHPEKWLDFGSRSTHEMTVAAKTLTQAFYGQPANYAYFNGCSTGGHQGFLEAQVWPHDYDGIVAGAPGHNRTHLHSDFVSDYQTANTSPATVISADKLTLLHNAVLAACAGKDGGLATDPFLTDPRQCTFEPSTLMCSPSSTGPNCLTPGEVATARHMYDGLRNQDSQELIYPGWSRGSETGWARMENPTGPAFPGILDWALGANYNPLAVNWDLDEDRVDSTLLPTVNFMNTDLSRFSRHGGRLLVYHGFADPIVATQDTINYFHRLTSEQHTPPAAVQKFARLFLVPGMGHCSGGPAPNTFDKMAPLVAWVENGQAPDSIIATKYTNDDPGQPAIMSRPLCAYPKESRYKGTGDPASAANWTCASDGNKEPFELTAAKYTNPFVMNPKVETGTIDLSQPNRLFEVVIETPEGSETFNQWVPSNLKAEEAAAVATQLSADGRRLTATFRRSEILAFTGGVPMGKPTDLMITGTLTHDGVQSLFAIGATVKLHRDPRNRRE